MLSAAEAILALIELVKAIHKNAMDRLRQKESTDAQSNPVGWFNRHFNRVQSDTDTSNETDH